MTPQHVTSLELSQRLKELGVPQKSMFYWIESDYLDGRRSVDLWSQWEIEYEGGEFKLDDYDYWSAYLSSELGELLPDGFKIVKKNKKFGVQVFLEGRMVYMGGRTMTQAMGAMLVHLLENNLITLEKGGEE